MALAEKEWSWRAGPSDEKNALCRILAAQYTFEVSRMSISMLIVLWSVWSSAMMSEMPVKVRSCLDCSVSSCHIYRKGLTAQLKHNYSELVCLCKRRKEGPCSWWGKCAYSTTPDTPVKRKKKAQKLERRLGVGQSPKSVALTVVDEEWIVQCS